MSRRAEKPPAGDTELVRTRTGTPEEVAAWEESFTGQYLKKMLAR